MEIFSSVPGLIITVTCHHTILTVLYVSSCRFSDGSNGESNHCCQSITDILSSLNYLLYPQVERWSA